MKLQVTGLLVLLMIVTGASQSQTDLLSKLGAGISVTIGGDFIVTGTFPAVPGEKLDQFITRIHLEAKQNLLSSMPAELLLMKKKELIAEVPLRNIRFIRSDKSEQIIDLLKFRNTGDLSLNPQLRNDDVIIFPPLDIERNFFLITGAVNKPGTYQYVDGDKLSDAIAIALGINKAYDNVNEAEISRLDFNGNNEEIIKVKIADDFLLKRGDRIRVGSGETQRKNFTIIVAGEVQFAGEFPVSKNSTTLYDVIKRSVLRETADLKAVRIVRSELLPPYFLTREYGLADDPEFKENLTDLLNIYADYEVTKLMRLSNLNDRDTVFFGMETRFQHLIGGTKVDLSANLEDAKEFIVRDGDLVIIPEKARHVQMLGYIKKPGALVHKEGKDYRYYIELAGGLGEYAIEDEIMVIKGGTQEWLSPVEQNVEIEPGDIIYIPRELNRSFAWQVSEVAGYFGIIGNIATLILLLTQFGK
ncbi:MAG: SLBB domain-containing protein [Ignavibacteriales bacterium]|nr:MAG: SLBB domain-containing protein [Ignavibacteriales bacterium]